MANPYKTLRSVVRFKPLETDRLERRLAKAASVADLRAIARRRLPRGVFDYVDGGAEDERTLVANSAAYAAAGRFPAAVQVAEKAAALAREQGLEGLAADVDGRLVAYRSGMPWREEPATRAKASVRFDVKNPEGRVIDTFGTDGGG